MPNWDLISWMITLEAIYTEREVNIQWEHFFEKGERKRLLLIQNSLFLLNL